MCTTTKMHSMSLNVTDHQIPNDDLEPALRELQEYLQQAYARKEPVYIVGDNSKGFLGPRCEARPYSMKPYQGIVSYEPSELVVTVKAGTRLEELVAMLSEQQQMLAFEPPQYSIDSTVGGMVAAGLAGPRRPYAGSVRDYVLGVQCMNGQSQLLSFGGQVIKNVAGYDVSRLLCGSYGTLAVLTQVSLRVAPRPETELSYAIELERDAAFDQLHQWIMAGLPISAAAYYNQQCLLRVSGQEKVLQMMVQRLLPSTKVAIDNAFWQQLNTQQLDFFSANDMPLWSVYLPSGQHHLSLQGEHLWDWGGMRLWLKSDLPGSAIREHTASLGGHAVKMGQVMDDEEAFEPLPEALVKYHRRIKQAFDPGGILNPGRMYRDW